MDEYLTAGCNLDEVSERLITLGGAPYSSMTEFLTQSVEERRGTFTKNVEESLTRVLEIFQYLMALPKADASPTFEGVCINPTISLLGLKQNLRRTFRDGGC